jgi:GDPmannose 4,6-dehydratase
MILLKPCGSCYKKKKPSDYVVATGVSKSVRDFVEEAYKYINVKIIWKGSGVNEIGIDSKTKRILIKIDKYYFRPTEVYELRGDSRKARRELKWKPVVSFKELVHEMVKNDIKNLRD